MAKRKSSEVVKDHKLNSGIAFAFAEVNNVQLPPTQLEKLRTLFSSHERAAAKTPKILEKAVIHKFDMVNMFKGITNLGELHSRLADELRSIERLLDNGNRHVKVTMFRSTVAVEARRYETPEEIEVRLAELKKHNELKYHEAVYAAKYTRLMKRVKNERAPA